MEQIALMTGLVVRRLAWLLTMLPGSALARYGIEESLDESSPTPMWVLGLVVAALVFALLTQQQKHRSTRADEDSCWSALAKLRAELSAARRQAEESDQLRQEVARLTGELAPLSKLFNLVRDYHDGEIGDEDFWDEAQRLVGRGDNDVVDDGVRICRM